MGMDWLMASSTPVFLNSKGSQIVQLNLKPISDAIGVDVVSYDFRRIIVTWALSHSNPLVREAEAPALNHKPNVAEEVYRQNRAVKPQLLVSQYNKEEAVISSEMKEDVRNMDPSLSKLISDMHAEQETRHNKEMMEEREKLVIQHQELKHLGPYHKISEKNKKGIEMELKKAGVDVLNLVQNLSKPQFRHKMLRIVCSPEAEELQTLWKVKHLVITGLIRSHDAQRIVTLPIQDTLHKSGSTILIQIPHTCFKTQADHNVPNSCARPEFGTISKTS